MSFSKYLYVFLLVFPVMHYDVAVAEEEPSQDVRNTPVVRAVSNSLPWVVSIDTESLVKVNDGYDELYHEFFGRILRPRQKIVRNTEPLGSGIIVNEAGLVLTNLHVVRRATKLEISLLDGTRLGVSVVGFDEPNDLALLRVTGELPKGKLNAATFGKPDDLLLGETVITIGNPFGLEHSVSQGVLSAINRNYSDDGSSFGDILQTDAAINPGNSGGPLINLKGELIGINQAMRRGASGIGFAIPVKRVEDFLAYWLLPSRFSNSQFGLSDSFEISRGEHNGIVFRGILPDGPAGRAGLRDGDEIVQVNGVKVMRLLDFGRTVWNMKAGEKMSVVLASGKEVTILLEEMTDEILMLKRLGIRVQGLTKELCEAMNLEKDSKGLVITEIHEETAYANQQSEWRKNLKRGDIIVQIDDKRLSSEKDLADCLRTRSIGD